MSQSQKSISCLLSIAVIFGIMLTITCLAVEDGNQDSSVVESSSVVEESREETSQEESSEDEESSEESSAESSEETSSEESKGDKYYYAGDVSYPPYTGSRVVKNPNVVEESDAEENAAPVEKDIKDWSYVARRWVFLPIIFTVLSLGGLIWFNVYAKKQNGKADKRNARRKERAEKGRNFDRPKH